jgi:hypothetical protein
MPRDGWSSIVGKFFAVAAAAGIAGLTACSVSTPDPAAGSGTAVPPSSSSSSSGAASAGKPSAAPSAGGTREACELFNALLADYQAVPDGDADGFEDIYLQAEDAKDTVRGDLKGLFASLSLLAIDHSASAEAGGTPGQESKNAVRDAVFANAGACTAEGVTLRL